MTQSELRIRCITHYNAHQFLSFISCYMHTYFNFIYMWILFKRFIKMVFNMNDIHLKWKKLCPSDPNSFFCCSQGILSFIKFIHDALFSIHFCWEKPFRISLVIWLIAYSWNWQRYGDQQKPHDSINGIYALLMCSLAYLEIYEIHRNQNRNKKNSNET